VSGYLDNFRRTGRLEYKIPGGGLLGNKTNTVVICANGDVTFAGKTVNVKRAKASGTLALGTAYAFGTDRSSDPYQVSINEKRPILGGRAEGLGSMRFDAGWDFPIIFDVLKSIAADDARAH